MVRGRSGDLLVADQEDSGSLLTSEDHVKRFKHEEVSQEENPSFLFADGTFKMLDLPRPCRVES